MFYFCERNFFNTLFCEFYLIQNHKRTLSSKSNSADTTFATIFVVVWLGPIIVTMNAKLLRGTV